MNGLGLNNQDKKAPVALVEWKQDAIAEAIELCDGLKGFDPEMKILLKPNLVEWVDIYPYAPFGIITTSVVIEAVLRVLKDAGARHITIGDGCAVNKAFGSETHILQERLGYQHLVDTYGVKVIDFNQGDHQRIPLGPHSLRVAKAVLEHDFMVNVPALKTHELCKVTLGFKNLKGVLHPKSKQRAHNPKTSVDEYLFYLANRFYPNVTIIDGIYMLEKGPMHTGTAHRSNLIVAGRDMFSVDLVGATLMGVAPQEVKHLALFAQEHNRSLAIDDIEVKGLNVSDHIRPLEIGTPWVDNNRIPEVFVKQNVQGFDLPFPNVLCTGCSFVYPNMLMFILSANKGVPFDNYELLAGEAAVPSGTANKTFLMGDCPIKDHKDNPAIKEAIMIRGCPPSQEDVFDALIANGVQGNKAAIEGYFNHIVKRYEKAGFPREDFYFKPDNKK